MRKHNKHSDHLLVEAAKCGQHGRTANRRKASIEEMSNVVVLNDVTEEGRVGVSMNTVGLFVRTPPER